MHILTPLLAILAVLLMPAAAAQARIAYADSDLCVPALCLRSGAPMRIIAFIPD